MTDKIIDTGGYIALLKSILNGSHFIDIRVRHNGQFYWFEADWLKRVMPNVELHEQCPDMEPAILEDHLGCRENEITMEGTEPIDTDHAGTSDGS